MDEVQGDGVGVVAGAWDRGRIVREVVVELGLDGEPVVALGPVGLVVVDQGCGWSVLPVGPVLERGRGAEEVDLEKCLVDQLGVDRDFELLRCRCIVGERIWKCRGLGCRSDSSQDRSVEEKALHRGCR